MSTDLSEDDAPTPAFEVAIGMSTWTFGLVLKLPAFHAPWLWPLMPILVMSTDDPKKARSPDFAVTLAMMASTSRPRSWTMPDPMHAPKLAPAKKSVRYRPK